MNDAFLITGGNIGDRVTTLNNALYKIEEQCGNIIATSGLYETAPWGNNDQPPFLNQAIHLQTSFSSNQLMRCLLKIEKEMGRVRKEKYGPRIIDIDMLFYNDAIFNSELLNIPHPYLQDRRFVLLPLNEIAEHLIHPVYQKTIAHLLQECTDKLEVVKYIHSD